jgi:TP901 family phage tail tape measure protein
MKKMQRNVKGFGKEFSSIMAGAAAVGAGIVTAMAVPINQAIQFESTMADVRKVVDFDTPEQFKQMGEDVLNLSTRLPMAAEGIGQIVAAGGQAGIAKNELLSFAESAVKMGVAFDQTAEESGQMMATWRTAFKMTQTDVVGLADKINYLGNTGPANAAKISEVVTRIGPLGEVAGVASGEIAAMGATIAGMGVESEIASTGIKNFMLSLTAGGAATASQKKALRALKISPKALAEDMQKDAKGTMLKVLDSMAKVPKAKQAAVMTALFGKESLGAIAPLLTNLDLLRSNFQKVSDAQTYSGSMQKEYASRAATTANAIQLFKNQMNAVSVTLGEIFLPALNKGMEKLMPFIEKLRNWVKENPELIKSIAKFGAYLLGTATAVGAVTKAFGLLNGVMKMSPLGKLVTLLVLAGGLIVENWDTVGPAIQSALAEINKAVEAMGGWESVLKGILAFMVVKWSVDMISSIGSVTKEMGKLGKATKGTGLFGGGGAALGRLGMIGAALTAKEYVADPLEERFTWLKDNVVTRSLNELPGLDSVDALGKKWLPWRRDETSDRGYQPSVPLLKPVGQQQQPNGELLVRFENSPPGMRVAPVSGSSSGISYDVGYNRFAKP